MKKNHLIMFIIIGFIFLTALGYAAIPHVINYQGRLTDKEDNPLNGNFLVTFRFYDVQDGGALLWEESHILSINNGVFSALLGSINPLKVDFDKDLWLGIEVATDGEMTPRIKLASSGYAFNAEAIDALDSSQLLRNDIDSVMQGSLTLKKDLRLEGTSRIVLTNKQGKEYYLWVDAYGDLRINHGPPLQDNAGSKIVIEEPEKVPPQFLKNALIILICVAILIVALILFSIKKR